MIDAMQCMSGPISGRQRAIVAVLRAGVEASIVRNAINGALRAFHSYPRAYYTRRQLAHSRPVLGPSRPLIDTRRHCARRQPGPIGKNTLLMTLCPPIKKSITWIKTQCKIININVYIVLIHYTKTQYTKTQYML